MSAPDSTQRDCSGRRRIVRYLYPARVEFLKNPVLIRAVRSRARPPKKRGVIGSGLDIELMVPPEPGGEFGGHNTYLSRLPSELGIVSPEPALEDLRGAQPPLQTRPARWSGAGREGGPPAQDARKIVSCPQNSPKGGCHPSDPLCLLFHLLRPTSELRRAVYRVAFSSVLCFRSVVSIVPRSLTAVSGAGLP